MEPTQRIPQTNKICKRCPNFVVLNSQSSELDLCESCSPAAIQQREVDLREIDAEIEKAHLSTYVLMRESNSLVMRQLKTKAEIEELQIKVLTCHSQETVEKIASLEKNLLHEMKAASGINEQLATAFDEITVLRNQRELQMMTSISIDKPIRSSTPESASKRKNFDDPIVKPIFKSVKGRRDA